MSDDDVRAGLDRVAGALVPPGDAVGKVRAKVQQRRRRRSAVRIGSASAGAAVALVAAVVLMPGQVLPDAAPPATVPTTESGEAVGALVSPDGLPGLELGSAPDVEDADLRQTASGCEGLQTREASLAAVGPAAVDSTEVIAWLRNGVVVALMVSAFPDRVEVPGDTPRTWLGPTLGSPLATALELSGARLVRDDPLGDAGPAISNLVVDAGDGVELVFSDVPVADQPSEGRVTTLVLRTEDGRGCGLVPGKDVLLPGQGMPEQQGSMVLTAQGTEKLRLGDPISEALAAGSVTPAEPDPFSDPLDGRGCTTYDATTTAGLQVWADGDTVVGIGTPDGGPRFTLTAEQTITSGQPLSDLEALPGTVPVASPQSGFGSAVDLQVAPGVRARVVGDEQLVVAETTGVLFPGPPLVDGVLLYQGDEPADSLCTS